MPFIVAAAHFHYWRRQETKLRDWMGGRETHILKSIPQKQLQLLGPKMLEHFAQDELSLKIPLGVASRGERQSSWVLDGSMDSHPGGSTTIQCPENQFLLHDFSQGGLRSNIVRCSHFCFTIDSGFQTLHKIWIWTVCAGKTAVFVHHLKEFLTICTHPGFYIVPLASCSNVYYISHCALLIFFTLC